MLFVAMILAMVGAMSAQTFSNIQADTSIGSCSACAGKNATGPSAVYWAKQGVSSPSLTGKATQFFVGGTTPYADALWNWTLVKDSSALHHFVYDMYFYYTNASAVQGMEFNVTSYAKSKGYEFGFTCSVKSGGVWKISTPNSSNSSLADMHWASTGIACPAPPTNTWNHLTFEVERTSTDQVHYISLTFNGHAYYINQTMPARVAPSSWAGLTTHFQLNGDSKQDDYSVWVDKYTVTADNATAGSPDLPPAGTSTCAAPSTNGINVCTAGGSSTSASVLAAAKVSGSIYRFELWADGVKKVTARNTSTMQSALSLGSGTHKLEFVAYNSSGSSRVTKTVTTTIK
jgi:hypothetical protein